MIVSETEGAKIIRENYLLWNPAATENEIVQEIRQHLGSAYMPATGTVVTKKKVVSPSNNFRAYKSSPTLVFLTLCGGLFGLAAIAIIACFVSLIVM